MLINKDLSHLLLNNLWLSKDNDIYWLCPCPFKNKSIKKDQSGSVLFSVPTLNRYKVNAGIFPYSLSFFLNNHMHLYLWIKIHFFSQYVWKKNLRKSKGHLRS